MTYLCILCTVLAYCGLAYSERTAPESAVSDRAHRHREQWNQWPIAEWDQNQWPSTQWNGSQFPATTWNQSQWPSGQWQKPSPPPPQLPPQMPSHGHKPTTVNPWWPPTHKPAIVIQNPTTLYPPIPTVGSTAKVTQSPPTIRPVNQNPSTLSPVPTTGTVRTTTTTTVRPPTTPAANHTNEPLGITVKSCGLSHIPQVFIGNKIVLGKVAKGGEFPWQTILKIHTARGPMQCGGAILNSRWILTAAHCVSNERNGQPTAQRVDVTAGIHNRLQMAAGSQQRTADCVVQHEGWSGQYGKFKHDIALLRIPAANPIDINHEKGGHVNGVCLPSTPMSDYSGKGRIAGWGLTKDRGTPSDVLMYTDVSILSNDKCRQYPYPVPISDSMICQGVDRTAPCQGDSGGPLIIAMGDNRGVQRMTEVGIVSFGPGECANAKTPNAIYTKVSHYLKWIEKTIKANSGQACTARELKTEVPAGDSKVEESVAGQTTTAEAIQSSNRYLVRKLL